MKRQRLRPKYAGKRVELLNALPATFFVHPEPLGVVHPTVSPSIV